MVWPSAEPQRATTPRGMSVFTNSITLQTTPSLLVDGHVRVSQVAGRGGERSSPEASAASRSKRG